jgi:hypothetical protein
LATTLSDETRVLYEIASDYTTIVNTYTVPQTSPDDLNKVSAFYALKNDETVIVLYATSGTAYPKAFEMWEYTIASGSMTKVNTLTLNARYAQGGCAVGNICYIMFNKGYVNANTSSEPFVIAYDMIHHNVLNTVYLDNFVETEGVTFRAVNSAVEMIFGENGGAWLYGALI